MIESARNLKVTLKTARELRSMTQIEAAKELGISADTLRSYEKGDSYPNVPMIEKLENLYGFGYNQLIFLPFNFGLNEDICGQ